MRLLFATALVACTAPGHARSIAYSLDGCLRMRAGGPERRLADCECEARVRCVAAGLPAGCAWDEFVMVNEGGYPVLAGGCK